MPIRAIILDVGGVLLHERDHTKRLAWEAHLGLAQGELARLVLDSELAKHAASGEVTERQVWQAVADYRRRCGRRSARHVGGQHDSRHRQSCCRKGARFW